MTSRSFAALRTTKRIGVIGTFVWDVIHGRHHGAAPITEWGGITYSLAGLDAALPDGWEIVPIMKVGSDLAEKANQFIRSLKRIAPDAESSALNTPEELEAFAKSL